MLTKKNLYETSCAKTETHQNDRGRACRLANRCCLLGQSPSWFWRAHKTLRGQILYRSISQSGVGRSRRKTIGRHGPLLSLHEARTIANGYLSDVVRGGDPAAEAQGARTAPTFRTLAEHYLSRHAVPKKRANSVKNDRAMLDRFILASLGNRKVSEIGYQDVQVLRNAIRNTPYQANRTLSLLSEMFELSIRCGGRADNPARGVEKFHEEKRHRWLSDVEISRLTHSLDRHPKRLAANAIRFQLLTGARIGEVLTAKWSDLDLDRGVWIKPSHHTKQKRTEHLPLSGAAIDLFFE